MCLYKSSRSFPLLQVMFYDHESRLLKRISLFMDNEKTQHNLL